MIFRGPFLPGDCRHRTQNPLNAVHLLHRTPLLPPPSGSMLLSRSSGICARTRTSKMHESFSEEERGGISMIRELLSRQKQQKHHVHV